MKCCMKLFFLIILFFILLIYIIAKSIYWPGRCLLAVVAKEVCVSVWVCAAETTISHSPRMCVIQFIIHSGHFAIQELKNGTSKHHTLTTSTWNKAMLTGRVLESRQSQTQQSGECLLAIMLNVLFSFLKNFNFKNFKRRRRISQG